MEKLVHLPPGHLWSKVGKGGFDSLWQPVAQASMSDCHCLILLRLGLPVTSAGTLLCDVMQQIIPVVTVLPACPRSHGQFIRYLEAVKTLWADAIYFYVVRWGNWLRFTELLLHMKDFREWKN